MIHLAQSTKCKRCGSETICNLETGSRICTNAICPVPATAHPKPVPSNPFFTLDCTQVQFPFASECERQAKRYIACPHCHAIAHLQAGWDNTMAHHLLVHHKDMQTELNLGDTRLMVSTSGYTVLKPRPACDYKPLTDSEMYQWLYGKVHLSYGTGKKREPAMVLRQDMEQEA